MSEIKEHLSLCLKAWPNHALTKFMIENGREYRHGPGSFTGDGEPKQCYANATKLMQRDLSLTYVEGKVGVYGLPIDHAWCVDAYGLVIDPTLDNALDGKKMERITGYFGIPFRSEYVIAASVANGYYGLLDGYWARKTLPKLIELGLKDGQSWLMAKARSAAIAAALIVATLLSPPDAQAQQAVTYGSDGRVIGRTVTGSDGSTVTYGADGRAATRTTTSPTTGSTTVYDASGRKAGSIEPERKR